MKFYKYFSEEQHMLNFIEKGEILFRPLSYFVNLEEAQNQKGRADKLEGHHIHTKNNNLLITKENGENILIKGGMLLSKSKLEDIYICCFTNYFNSNNTFFIKEFGEFCLKINDLNVLIDKIKYSLNLLSKPSLKDKYDFIHKNVTYNFDDLQDDKILWALPENITFVKRKEFEWQKEYRIAFAVNKAFNIENVDLSIAINNYNNTRYLIEPEKKKQILYKDKTKFRNKEKLILSIGNIEDICSIEKI